MQFLVDIFIKDQSEDDDVEEVQVMSCTEDKMFIFALITYKNERAITMAIDFFRFTGMFTQRVTLKKSEAKSKYDIMFTFNECFIIIKLICKYTLTNFNITKLNSS